MNASLQHVMRAITVAATLAASSAALAQTPAASSTPSTQKDQVVVPEIDRRDVRLPRIASRDFEIGVYGGLLSVQNFGTNAMYGLRAGYHVTEDFFAELSYGASKVSDETYRRILPGGLFPTGTSTFKTTTLSVGYNVLPGEIFIGRRNARATSLYLLGGVGTTNFADQKRQTFNLGAGMRVYLADRVSLRVDVRDHLFSLDLLGKRERTHNWELSTGLSYLF